MAHYQFRTAKSTRSKSRVRSPEALETRAMLSAYPLGEPFAVNLVTADEQNQAAVAVNESGRFVVTWTSDFQESIVEGNVIARVYAADGTPITGEISVNQTTANEQGESDVAIDTDGNFVVVWKSLSSVTSTYEIQGRRFSASGTPLGNEFQINTQTVGDQTSPQIAITPANTFFVVWNDSVGHQIPGLPFGTVEGRRLDASGSPSGSQFTVADSESGTQSNGRIAVDAMGNAVVVFNSDIQSRMRFQRLNSTGQLVGGPTDVSPSAGKVWDVAMNADGEFVVSFDSEFQISPHEVFARKFDANGNSLTEDILVSHYGANFSTSSSVAIDASGDFVVAWGIEFPGGDAPTMVRRYLADGTPDGTNIPIPNGNPPIPTRPSVANVAHGDFVVALTGGRPVDGSGILAQRFRVNDPPLANAGGPYSILEGDVLHLDATGTQDPDPGDLLSYAWDINGDGVFGDTTGVAPQLTWAQLRQLLNVSDAPVNGQVRVRVSDPDGHVTTSAAVPLLVANEPARVIRVAIRGTSSVNSVYDIPSGSGEQLRTVPVALANQIRIGFDQAAVVDMNDLILTGERVATYPISDFSYNATNFEATWTFAPPFGADRMTIRLAGAGPSPVTDLAGAALDGEWENPVSLSDDHSQSYPSGNGAPGGDFQFQFRVLPGDANRDGGVGTADYALWAAQFGRVDAAITTDFDGNGSIGAGDYVIWAANFGINHNVAPLIASPLSLSMPSGSSLATSTRLNFHETILIEASSVAQSRVSLAVPPSFKTVVQQIHAGRPARTRAVYRALDALFAAIGTPPE